MPKDMFGFVILGAGGRGQTFARWLYKHPGAGRVVAVAEPRLERRRQIAQMFDIPEERQFNDWQSLLAVPQLADAVINTTMDKDHAESSVAALNIGYHMLLDKPMATTLKECVAIDNARCGNNRIVSVCHSQRYHVVFAKAKELIASGAIGRLITFDHIEGVDPVHQSHSFVRGNWGNESKSAFMLLAKSCHDIDLIAWMVGRPCLRVSSFGALTHFCEQNAPNGAPLRCTDGCPSDKTCMYSVNRVYLTPESVWWHAIIAGIDEKYDYKKRLNILNHSPYGRCVYHCDNDVVDHQVVSFEFDGHVTGTFTMTAFDTQGRRTRFHGTEGTLTLSSANNTLELIHFSSSSKNIITMPMSPDSHGGADHNCYSNFVDALRQNSESAVLTGTKESLDSHKIVFASEISRREGRIVSISELS